MTAFIITALLGTLAVARVTRIIALDKIALPFRMWVLHRNGREGWFTYLVHCPYCVGVWLAAPAGALLWFLTEGHTVLGITSWVGVPMYALAMSYGASMIAAHES